MQNGLHRKRRADRIKHLRQKHPRSWRRQLSPCGSDQLLWSANRQGNGLGGSWGVSSSQPCQNWLPERIAEREDMRNDLSHSHKVWQPPYHMIREQQIRRHY